MSQYKKRKNHRLQNIKHELLKSKLSLICFVILVVIILVSVFAFLSPYDPDQVNVGKAFSAPDREHLVGTDDLGRDYLTRALYGGRISLLVGFLAMLISVSLGVLVGTISGYYGGWIDNILMRCVDILQAIPWMILVTVVSIFLKPGIQAIILVIGFFTWMRTARLVRAEALSVKEREYVLYAKTSGQSSVKIMLKHIIPSILPTIIVAGTTSIADAIMMESTLSFLGLGVQQPMSSWGSMLQIAQGRDLYLALLPGLLIVATIFCFNKMGDVLRVAMEPKMKGSQ